MWDEYALSILTRRFKHDRFNTVTAIEPVVVKRNEFDFVRGIINWMINWFLPTLRENVLVLVLGLGYKLIRRKKFVR